MPSSHADSEATVAEEFNRLRGQILGLIESWGLPEKQERGAKATFKTLSYDAEARVKDLIRVGT